VLGNVRREPRSGVAYLRYAVSLFKKRSLDGEPGGILGFNVKLNAQVTDKLKKVAASCCNIT
jgi:hypothetical protein